LLARVTNARQPLSLSKHLVTELVEVTDKHCLHFLE
jgi:hypothetical protein